MPRKTARERLEAERKAALARAEGIEVTPPPPAGRRVPIESLPIGTKVRTSTGVTLRLENVGLGSAAVTVIDTTKESDSVAWRKGDRHQIAPGAVVEVVE